MHPDDRERSVAQQREVAAGRDIGPVEYRWKVKSGEYRWFSDSRKVIRDRHGRAIALVGVSRDVTEDKHAEEALKENERQLRELSQRLTYHVDNSPLAVIEWGPDMRLIRWSSTAERVFGWRADRGVGQADGGLPLDLLGGPGTGRGGLGRTPARPRAAPILGQPELPQRRVGHRLRMVQLLASGRVGQSPLDPVARPRRDRAEAGGGGVAAKRETLPRHRGVDRLWHLGLRSGRSEHLRERIVPEARGHDAGTVLEFRLGRRPAPRGRRADHRGVASVRSDGWHAGTSSIAFVASTVDGTPSWRGACP